MLARSPLELAANRGDGVHEDLGEVGVAQAQQHLQRVCSPACQTFRAMQCECGVCSFGERTLCRHIALCAIGHMCAEGIVSVYGPCSIFALPYGRSTIQTGYLQAQMHCPCNVHTYSTPLYTYVHIMCLTGSALACVRHLQPMSRILSLAQPNLVLRATTDTHIL
jgi:hypothetical protein